MKQIKVSLLTFYIIFRDFSRNLGRTHTQTITSVQATDKKVETQVHIQCIYIKYSSYIFHLINIFTFISVSNTKNICPLLHVEEMSQRRYKGAI